MYTATAPVVDLVERYGMRSACALARCGSRTLRNACEGVPISLASAIRIYAVTGALVLTKTPVRLHSKAQKQLWRCVAREPSVRHVSDRLGIDHSQFWRILSGRVISPHTFTRDLIFALFGIDPCSWPRKRCPRLSVSRALPTISGTFIDRE